jgi:hypothetical protein
MHRSSLLEKQLHHFPSPFLLLEPGRVPEAAQAGAAAAEGALTASEAGTHWPSYATYCRTVCLRTWVHSGVECTEPGRGTKDVMIGFRAVMLYCQSLFLLHDQVSWLVAHMYW